VLLRGNSAAIAAAIGFGCGRHKSHDRPRAHVTVLILPETRARLCRSVDAVFRMRGVGEPHAASPLGSVRDERNKTRESLSRTKHKQP
jgi:hypothetical protein